MANLSVGEEVSSGGTGQRDRENAWRRGPGHRRENPIRGALLGTGKLVVPFGHEQERNQGNEFNRRTNRKIESSGNSWIRQETL
jgi:hypothetical protein